MNFLSSYFKDIATISQKIDLLMVERLAMELAMVHQNGGRLFFLGIGGSAANCSHAVNDFRKLCHFEAYSPLDNVSELTARTNDDGWQSIFIEWLKISRLSSRDALFILSVGGGDLEHNISPNLITAIDYASTIGAKIFGIVGPHGGYTKQKGDCVISIPVIHQEIKTPLSEAFQSVIWHALVSHPRLQAQKAKWESVDILNTACSK